MKHSKIFWDKLAPNYDTQVTKYDDAYRKTIEKTKKYLSYDNNILDCACGTGITTTQIAGCVKTIDAFDISDKMLTIAADKTKAAGINNINYNVTDIYDEKYKPASYNVVLAFNILQFYDDVNAVLERAHQLLKPGGYFISVTDCMGEQKSLRNILMAILGKIRVVPVIKQYKTKELEQIISSARFEIKETKNLYDMPPNYFIAAEKSINN